MQVRSAVGRIDEQVVGAVVVGISEKETVKWRWLRDILREEGFEGKSKQVAVVHTQGKLAAKRVIVMGLGKSQDFNAEVVRRSVGTAVAVAKKSKVKTLAIEANGWPQEAIVTGAVLANYGFNK